MEQRQTVQQTEAERVWLEHQRRKALGRRSKYVPHQNAREKARRLARIEVAR